MPSLQSLSLGTSSNFSTAYKLVISLVFSLMTLLLLLFYYVRSVDVLILIANVSLVNVTVVKVAMFSAGWPSEMRREITDELANRRKIIRANQSCVIPAKPILIMALCECSVLIL